MDLLCILEFLSALDIYLMYDICRKYVTYVICHVNMSLYHVKIWFLTYVNMPDFTYARHMSFL